MKKYQPPDDIGDIWAEQDLIQIGAKRFNIDLLAAFMAGCFLGVLMGLLL